MARDRRAREDLIRDTARRLERGDSRRDILDGLRFHGLSRGEAETILREASPPHGWAFKTAAALLLSLVIVGVVSWRMELLPDIIRAVRPPPTATATPRPIPTSTPILFPTATAILAPEAVAAAPTSTSEGGVPILEPLPLPISPLTFRVIDAEYSKKLDRIIMVSSSPNQLHVYDPSTQKDTAVNLPLLPSAISVSPDGQYAAVGHDAWISYVDLAAASLVKTLPVSTDVLDVVLGGNGYVYAFPRRDQWETIRSVNIATGVETLSQASSIYAGTVAKLHPNGRAMYGADNGLSPSDIYKYSIEKGPAERLYDSSYHGDYSMCGDLWISQDGLRIFTKCGNVFRSSDVRSEDMVYNGSLREAKGFIRHVTHSDVIDKVIVIPQAGYTGGQMWDTQIQVYDYQYLTFEKALGLPEFVVKDRSYPGHGRFVFVSGDGSKILVILQADEPSGMLFDYGVVDLSTQDFLTVTARPTPTPTPTVTASTLAAVNFDSDVPGQAPKIGGANQPTSLLASQGTTMAVRSEANGIATQPVVLTSEGGYVGVDISFDPVDEGVVRLEATVAFDRLVDGFFLQTVAYAGGPVVTRLRMTSSGDIKLDKTVGSYGPYQPFRVRMDIDMSGKTWWVTVDDELNGFYDDLVFGDLPFENPAGVLPRVSMVSLSLYPAFPQGFTSVAYDDIRVSAPHQRPLG